MTTSTQTSKPESCYNCTSPAIVEAEGAGWICQQCNKLQPGWSLFRDDSLTAEQVDVLLKVRNKAQLLHDKLETVRDDADRALQQMVKGIAVYSPINANTVADTQQYAGELRMAVEFAIQLNVPQEKIQAVSIPKAW